MTTSLFTEEQGEIITLYRAAFDILVYVRFN